MLNSFVQFTLKGIGFILFLKNGLKKICRKKLKIISEVTSILRVLQAIPSPLPVVYSIKIVQEEFDF
jgi:hypothetical protein